jgi:S1-C subfamily serine protease
MARLISVALVLVLLAQAQVARAAAAAAVVAPDVAQKIYDDATGSLVAVQFTWEYEFGKVELTGPGVVVSDDGLVMLSLAVVSPTIPDAQLTDFKLILPHMDRDDEEVEATWQGRDERNNVVFVKANEKRDWKPVKFVRRPLKVGEPVLSVGLMPKSAGYRSYLAEGVVAAFLRGEIKHTVVTGGGLSAVGSPVFNTAGEAVGFVNFSREQQFLLGTSNRRQQQDITTTGAIDDPPHLFTPTSEFAQALSDPPSPGKPVQMPWMGAPQLTGLPKDVAEVFGLANQPVVEIGDIIPGSPADAAGLKVRQKIVKFNGEPLERGDEPDEAAQILTRKLLRMKPGDTVTFAVIEKKSEPPRDIQVTLGDRPKRANQAQRFWAEDLGFSVRELVFDDTYIRHQPRDLKALAVGLIKPSSAAANAKLSPGDLITQFNNTPVESLEQFEKDYKAFRGDKPHEAIVLVVLKPDGQTQTIRIEPPQ